MYDLCMTTVVLCASVSVSPCDKLYAVSTTHVLHQYYANNYFKYIFSLLALTYISIYSVTWQGT
jgi:hypothetical protein